MPRGRNKFVAPRYADTRGAAAARGVSQRYAAARAEAATNVSQRYATGGPVANNVVPTASGSTGCENRRPASAPEPTPVAVTAAPRQVPRTYASALCSGSQGYAAAQAYGQPMQQMYLPQGHHNRIIIPTNYAANPVSTLPFLPQHQFFSLI